MGPGSDYQAALFSRKAQGLGVYSWSFEKADEAGVCSLTLTYDGVHSLIMLSKGKDLQ